MSSDPWSIRDAKGREKQLSGLTHEVEDLQSILEKMRAEKRKAAQKYEALLESFEKSKRCGHWRSPAAHLAAYRDFEVLDIKVAKLDHQARRRQVSTAQLSSNSASSRKPLWHFLKRPPVVV